MNKTLMDNDAKDKIDYVSFHDYYYKCSIENYNLYKIANTEHRELTEGIKCWDILSHTKEENAKYFSSWSDKQYYAILSIIFQALSVEAWINYYGAKTFGIDKYNREYEKLPTSEKYLAIYKEVKHKDFPKGKKEYNNLKLLFRLRDRLVHSKAYMINMRGGSDQDFFDSLNELFGGRNNNIFTKIDNVMCTYNQLVTLFLKIDNN